MWASALYLDVFCVSISKMCSNVSEKTKRACKDVTLNVKLNIIKHFDHGEQNRDIVHALSFVSGNTQKIFQRNNNCFFPLCHFGLQKVSIGMLYFQRVGETCIHWFLKMKVFYLEQWEKNNIFMFSLTCSTLIWSFKNASFWTPHLTVHHHLLLYNNNGVSDWSIILSTSFLKDVYLASQSILEMKAGQDWKWLKRMCCHFIEQIWEESSWNGWAAWAMAVLLEQMNHHPGDSLEGEGIVYYREREIFLNIILYICGKNNTQILYSYGLSSCHLNMKGIRK